MCWQRFPPTVARFRSCGDAACSAASASAGQASRTSFEAATAASVAIAPTLSVPSAPRSIAESPGTISTVPRADQRLPKLSATAA